MSDPIHSRSIFTSKDSSTTPVPPPPPSLSSLRAPPPRTSSPFRRPSEDPIALAVQGGVGAVPATSPSSFAREARQSLATTGTRPADGSVARPPAQDHTPSPSIWTSFGDRLAVASPTAVPSAHRNSAAFTGDCALQELLPHSSPPSPSNPPKRKSSAGGPRTPSSQPPSKRLKIRPRLKHTLNSSTSNFGLSNLESSVPPPPSPLFFSNSPRPRPTLPPRFSSSEAGLEMMSKARTEDSHVKTVSLARGVVTPGVGGLLSSSAQHSRKSLDRLHSGRSSSPDTVASNGGRDGASLGIGNMLQHIGITELLEQDERPTFIVDLGDSTNYGVGFLNPIFCNSSLRSYDDLKELICGRIPDGQSSPDGTNFLQFKAWLLSAAVDGESLMVCLPPFTYGDVVWSCSTLRKRLRIISGAFNTPPASATAAMRVSIPPGENTRDSEAESYFDIIPDAKAISTPGDAEVLPTIEPGVVSADENSLLRVQVPPDLDLSEAIDLLPRPNVYVQTPTFGANTGTSGGSHLTDQDAFDSQIATVPSDSPSFDWTRLPVSDSMPKHIQFARSIDWASTSLGPIENWNPDLRQMCNLIMASPHPAAMYWGEDLIAIYNEAYILLAGQKHPTLMGQSYRVAWAEIWDEVREVFANAKSTGEATMKDDDCLFIRRSDNLEETYFSWSIIPMVAQNGQVAGLYNPAFEKTRRKIAERRMLTLREVGERTASARDVKGFWGQVLNSFEFNEYDSPFLILYSVSDDSDSDSSSIHSGSTFANRQCMLEGSLGVPEGHQAAPDQIDIKTGVEGFGPVFREVLKTDKPLLLDVGSRDLPENLVEGLEPRGFGDPVKAVVVCPIHPTTGEAVLGFLVLGVNPRRPYDDDYSLFIQLLSRQLATSLASVVLFEEEIRRGQKAAKMAALDRIELSEKLAARTAEAIESETKFTRMAEFAPVGMFIASSSGKITFANDCFLEISRVPKGSHMADTWMDAIQPEDIPLVQQAWQTLVVDVKSVSIEFRFKAQWQDKAGNPGETWVLFSCYPEKYDDGRLKSIFGSITDISKQKWAEGLQTRKMEEAVELKRQQENFIDITSHEMRNPLSAILQCSDEIASSLGKFRQGDERILPDELITSCLDAAQTISLCSLHQKRIVDDILTLSKLDSQLLLVTPVDAQPLTVVQRALKMHEGELQAADIQMKFVVDHSFREMGLDWVRCDPSRVLQVLINLTTNAIKFTGTENKRTITVSIGASTRRPSENPDAPVKYFPTRKKDRDTMTDKEWGQGEKVYITFGVRDTGRGLSPEEKKLLFHRFSQASPRTHVQYGGSGLGLFISRELTELQGGEIGVESETGKGSIFAFYIAARKSIQPQDSIDSTTNPKRSNPLSSRSKTEPSPAAKNAAVQRGEGGKPRPAGNIAKSVKKVLIVEDNLVNQKVLSKQLKNIGTEVHVANHGGEALEQLMRSTYWCGDNKTPTAERIELGVILMDQEMPVMDGLTCTKKIRELEAEGKFSGHVPIIAVTANARAEQVQTALDAGMDDVVSKPFRIPDLVPKIEELLERHPMPLRGGG